MDNTDISQYFKSRSDMYVFILVHTDGETRSKLLSIRYGHFSSKERAKKWYDKIYVEVKDHDKAVEKLTEIYECMTDY